MSGVNKVIIVGRCGKDPVINSTVSGNMVANLSVATSESWKDKTTGEKKEKVEWHRAVAFGRLAEIIGQYIKKGSLIYIEGRLATKEWGKDGVTRYTTEIILSQMQMLGGKQDSKPVSQKQEQPTPGQKAFGGGVPDGEIPF